MVLRLIYVSCKEIRRFHVNCITEFHSVSKNRKISLLIKLVKNIHFHNSANN